MWRRCASLLTRLVYATISIGQTTARSWYRSAIPATILPSVSSPAGIKWARARSSGRSTKNRIAMSTMCRSSDDRYTSSSVASGG
uniref:Putative secreted protein n=1 Tax=Anopheles darlingi TaxID=43151 RepID=A0A2M4DFK9_ANODA